LQNYEPERMGHSLYLVVFDGVRVQSVRR